MNKIIDILIEHGYDSFFSNGDIIVLKNGYSTNLSVDNTLKLMSGEFPISDYDIACIIMENHKIKQEISEGKYDNIKPLTPEESLEKLKKLLKKK